MEQFLECPFGPLTVLDFAVRYGNIFVRLLYLNIYRDRERVNFESAIAQRRLEGSDEGLQDPTDSERAAAVGSNN